jgi:four helix bundle protein
MALLKYEDLAVYKRAFELALVIHAFTDKNFPKSELYGGMADQLRRSSKSICANLAEGLGKRMSIADKRRFIQIALGSAEESRVWLAFAGRLKYGDNRHIEGFRREYEEISRMLYKLQENLTDSRLKTTN